MFTSRAEYRILLRQDDADLRLTPRGREIGLVDNARWNHFLNKKKMISEFDQLIQKTKLPVNSGVNDYLNLIGSKEISQSTPMKDLLKRPGVSILTLIEFSDETKRFLQELPQNMREEIADEVEILIKYDGYITREKEMAEKTLRLEKVRIPDDMDYNSFQQLSIESRQKLSTIRPKTIGEASRIPGVSPADISILLLKLRN